MNLFVTRTFKYVGNIKCSRKYLPIFRNSMARYFCKHTTGIPMSISQINVRFSDWRIYVNFRSVSYNLTNIPHRNFAQVHPDNVSSFQIKKRPQKKKRPVPGEDGKHGFWSTVAYATAEEYDLDRVISNLLKQELYSVVPIDQNDSDINDHNQEVIHAAARYVVGSEPRELFIFREGTVVFWNMDEMECSNILTFLKSYEQNPYDELLVQSENDVMSYSYTDERKSCIANGVMLVNSLESVGLDKYTFSNAMALSVKLSIWEACLDRYVDNIEFVTEDLKRGNKIKMTREEVLRKTGELFALRHHINLSSDLLDTPDFYWDRESQEALYHQTCSYFSIQKRTRVMNEKLNHCLELVELLSSRLNDEHHVRLEWMVIILIMVEVVFEFIHYVERFS